MRFMKLIGPFVFSAVMVAICLHHVSAETFNRVVAIVNNDVITLHELNKKMEAITGLKPDDFKSQNDDRYLETRRRILDLLINDKIAQEKIRELGIRVTQRQMDAAIERTKKDNQWTHEDLTETIEKSGMTYEKYLENIKRDLERVQLINFEVKSKIIIREEKISQYYEEHKEKFGGNEKVHLASIFLMHKDSKDEGENRELYRRGEDILARLRMGEDFGGLARKYSEGPGADEGGDLGTFKTTQLEPELRKIFEAMPEGGVTDLIKRPNGIQIIKLIKKEKGKAKSLEEARDAIYGVLYNEEVNRMYMSWIKRLRESSYTKIIF